MLKQLFKVTASLSSPLPSRSRNREFLANLLIWKASSYEEPLYVKSSWEVKKCALSTNELGDLETATLFESFCFTLIALAEKLLRSSFSEKLLTRLRSRVSLRWNGLLKIPILNSPGLQIRSGRINSFKIWFFAIIKRSRDLLMIIK